MTTASRKPYPSDISDEGWALAALYITLMREDAEQQNHSLRELLNGRRYLMRTGIPWRSMPHDLPRWDASRVLRRTCPGSAGRAAHGGRARTGTDHGCAGQACGFAWTAAPCAARPRAAPGPATTGPSASAAARCTWLWRRNRGFAPTPWATCWRCTSLQPMPRTAPPSNASPKTSRTPPAKAWGWPTSTRVALARSPPPLRRIMVSAWKWLSCPRRGAASCCCHGAESLSVRSLGPRAAVASSVTTQCRAGSAARSRCCKLPPAARRRCWSRRRQRVRRPHWHG